MATLNRTETEMLGEAMTILSTVRSVLKEMADGKPADPKDLKWLSGESKKAYDNISTVRTMKGHYPK